MLSGYFVERRERLQDPVIVAADLGYSKKGRNFAARLGCSMAFIEKRRRGNDPSAEALTIVGEVADHDVIVVDDEVATGGSVVQAVELIKAHGAREVYLCFVHPVFAPDAVGRLASLPVKQIVTTNTIPLTASQRAALGDRLVVLSVAPLLGEVILRAHEGRSVGEMFNE
jgi:ribose-phosphate pyrophosphokinase